MTSLEERAGHILEYISQLRGAEFTQRDISMHLSVSQARVSDVLLVLTTCFVVQRQGRGFVFDRRAIRDNFGQFISGLRPGRDDTMQEATKTAVYAILHGKEMPKTRRTYEALSVLRAAGIITRAGEEYKFASTVVDFGQLLSLALDATAIIDRKTQERTVFDNDYFMSQ